MTENTPLGETPFRNPPLPAELNEETAAAEPDVVRDFVKQIIAEVSSDDDSKVDNGGRFTTGNSKELVALVGYIGASQLGTGLLESAGLTWEAVLPMVLVALKAWNLWRSKH